jgi:HSP20 family protein
MEKKSAKPGGGVKGGLEVDLGGLFGTLGSAVDLLGKLAEAGAKHVQHSDHVTLESLGDEARGVCGFSIRAGRGGAGAASVEPFGNIPASTEGETVADEVHEPMVDVFDEGCEIVVTAELPGAREDDITVEQRDAVLTIESQGERCYAKEVLLPGAIDVSSLQKKYNNGVLEIRARKIRAQGGE